MANFTLSFLKLGRLRAGLSVVRDGMTA